MTFFVKIRILAVSSIGVTSCFFGPPWSEETSRLEVGTVNGETLRAEVWCVTKPKYTEQIRVMRANQEVLRFDTRTGFSVSSDCSKDHPESVSDLVLDLDKNRLGVASKTGIRLWLPFFAGGLLESGAPGWEKCVADAFSGALVPKDPRSRAGLDWQWEMSEMPRLVFRCNEQADGWRLVLENEWDRKFPFPALTVELYSALRTEAECKQKREDLIASKPILQNGVLRIGKTDSFRYLPWRIYQFDTIAWMNCLVSD
jgi:hypothetical protein